MRCCCETKKILALLFVAVAVMVNTVSAADIDAGKMPHVVFITGDDEYRSEESMPMLARILKERYHFRVTVCYSLAKDGSIDPAEHNNVTGIEALDDADLMVLFTRFRDLSEEQFKHFLKYVAAGKPIVGFRTATHAFKFDTHPQYKAWGWHGEKIAQLVGQNWITHHGHFSDGHKPLTDVTLVAEQKSHPILRGVKPFAAFSWLYHVEGGGDKLRGDAKPLLMGRSLKSNHAMKGNTKRYPLSNPVAWTKTYTGKSGTTGRVFFATTAHSYDFKLESVRKLAINGIFWALSMEQKIPADGADVKIIGTYKPNNSGMNAFKTGLKPQQF